MTADNRQTGQFASLWAQLRATAGRGPAPYVLTLAYATIVSALLLLNPTTGLGTDMVVVLFLLLMFVIYRAPTMLAFKLTLGTILLGVIMPVFGVLNPFYIDVVTKAGMFASLALGLNVVVGFAGLLDLGYVAFFAVGAYLWGIFSTPQISNIVPGMGPLNGSWFWLFLAIGLAVGALFGVLLGLPVLRLRGDYLAIVTLGLGEVIRVLATNLDRPVNITNGAQGIKDVGRPPLFVEPLFKALGLNISVIQEYQLYFYFLVLLILALTVLVVYRLNNSRIGRAWTAIREDETAAIAMGVPLVRMKLLAFAVGASFAGTMGVIFSALQTFINPPTFDLLRSIGILSMVILGGMGSIPGTMLGAVIVTLLDLQLLPRIASELSILQRRGVPIPSWFDPAQYQRLLFGLLLVIMMIFRPEGLLPEDRRRQELHQDDLPAPAAEQEQPAPAAEAKPEPGS